MDTRLLGVATLVLCGAGAAVGQVRIAPPEASGVAKRAAAEPAVVSPADDSLSSPRVVVTPKSPTFTFGFTSHGYLPAGYFGRRYYSRTFSGPYGYRHAYCPRCGGLFSTCGCRSPFYLPPVYVDPGVAYGPRAVARFLVGEQNVPAIGPINPAPAGVINNNAPVQRNAGPLLPPEPRLAPFNQQARGRAWKFIDYGDKQFRKGAYREAIQRYRKAAATDTGLGEAHFRQGWAELARGNLGRSSVALRRGLRIDPEWPAADFVLEELFNDPTRQQVLATIEQALDATPNDIDALFVRGVVRHFDGNPAAAARDFARVGQLTGGDPAAAAFLPRAAAAPNPAENPRAK